jgi:cis-L-3-hydroxyproline dehydratase
MKIARIEVYGYDLSCRYGKYIMSGNQVIDTIPSTVVRIITNSGINGWGEVCPLGPLYLNSHGFGARAALQQMLPILKGLDPTNLSSVLSDECCLTWS